MENIFKDGESVFEKQMQEVFQSIDNKSILFSVISFVFYHDKKVTEIYDIYRLLGIDNFIKLVHLLDGETIKLPTSTELRELILMILCFYYREVEGLEWGEVHDKIPFRFNSISMSYKIKSLNDSIRSELIAIFNGTLGKKEDKNAGK